MGQIISNCVAGIISGLMSLIAGISYATLIFSGSLSGGLPLGICGALVSASVVGAIVALRSSSPYAIAGPDANISAIIAVMAASVGTALGGSVSPVTFISTMWTLIVLSALIAGVFFYLVGQFHLGRWIRFIPYPVIGGFLAGTGWLLVRGAFKVMAGAPLTIDNLSNLAEAQNVVHWLPGVVMAAVLVGILRRYKHFLVMPTLLAGAIVLFHAWIQLAGGSIEGAIEQGWLLEKLPSNLMEATWGGLSLQSISWSLIRAETGNLVALTILAAIVILLNAASVEIATRSDVDLDRELTTTGLANLAAAPLGGLVGCLALSRTLLNWKAGANGSLAGIVAALLSALVLLLGTSCLNYLPKPVLGALLVYLGSSLLIEWVYDGWSRFSRFDFFLVLMILFTVAARGFLEGVGIGLIVACLLFAFSYSRVSVIQHELSGAGYRSNVERSYLEQKVLRQRGDEIYILCLQGYIFFGTAYPLLTHILGRVRSTELPRVRFIVFDFSHVSGLDSSSVLGFHKILQTCEQNGMQPVFASLRNHVRDLLQEGGCIGETPSDEDADSNEGAPRHFPDLDYAVSWCEEQTLAFEGGEGTPTHPSLEDLFGELFRERETVARLRSYLERVETPAGHALFQQGQAADSLYLVESGEVTVLLELPNGDTKRLRTMGAGTVVGEMGIYLDKPRSGTIITNKPCVLHRLSAEAFKKLRAQDHELALAFHEFMVRVLANRLAHANEELAQLLW